MSDRFRDRVVWVTGASAGLGAALAAAFAAEGARLVLSARDEKKLEHVAGRCGGSGRCRVLPLDLSDVASLDQVGRDAEAAFGRIDVLVNNAAVSQRARAEDTEMSVNRYIMDVNYTAAVALTRAVLPGMLARGSGQIVAVSSLVGYLGTPLRSAYAASKHALHGFYDCLRAEVHDRGIRITVVCPGFVRTDVSRNALTGDGTPWGRLDPGQEGGMDPDRCAARVVTAVARGRREALIGGREVALVYLQRFLPGLCAWLIRRIPST